MKHRSGFSLVELVVVIMILGILAAVAAPKLLNTSSAATDNSLRQSLSVVRDAIELYAAQNNGALPGQSDNLQADLANYLRGGVLPNSPVGSKLNSVKYSTGTGAISGESGTASTVAGWNYNKTTGEFICNFNGATTSNSSINYDDL
ncbi:MAG: type II secretion system protein [Pirellulaceae bacterium]|nr:type II secretion system protein [Planctomycetales bacterium]MCA9162128.1 type II secretion system protein [Planctomycetales bacterium]MCA9228612.1 type II secretion system protein [Planctomycetales bacterium]